MSAGGTPSSINCLTIWSCSSVNLRWGASDWKIVALVEWLWSLFLAFMWNTRLCPPPSSLIFLLLMVQRNGHSFLSIFEHFHDLLGCHICGILLSYRNVYYFRPWLSWRQLLSHPLRPNTFRCMRNYTSKRRNSSKYWPGFFSSSAQKFCLCPLLYEMPITQSLQLAPF